MSGGSLAGPLAEELPSIETTSLATDEARWWARPSAEDTTALVLLHAGPGSEKTTAMLRHILHTPVDETPAADSFSALALPWWARWTARWAPPSTSGSTSLPETLAGLETPVLVPRSLRAVRAVEDLREWLDLTLEDVARLCGFARRSWYHWRAGMDPRPASVRRLFQIYGVVEALIDVLGPERLRAWLREPGDQGWSRSDLLAEPDGPARVLREAGRVLFVGEPPVAEPWVLPDFAGEDLEMPPDPSTFGPPMRSARRRVDR